MWVAMLFKAPPTQVEVLTEAAVPAEPGRHGVGAVVAGVHEGRQLRVVHVPQHHHTAVLGTAECIELIMIALAEVQERLPRGEEG